MAFPAIIPLTANKRVPFDQTIALMNWDLSGSTLRMEIRNEPGNQGSPLIPALTNQTPPTQGLSVTWDADYPDPDGVLPNGASLIRIMIDETTLEGLSYAVDPSKPLPLDYDIHASRSSPSITKFVFCGGDFFIDPGVTL
jgi:hypothetical protein